MRHLWTPWRMPYLRSGGESGPAESSAECLFCRKAKTSQDTTEHILYRGEHCYVTLNLYPYNNGHLLVVPYRHVSRLDDLDAEEAGELITITQTALKVLDQAYNPEGYNMGINQGSAAGAGIAAHLHQHIVPRWSGDTNFMTIAAQTRVIPEWIDETYAVLKVIWDKLASS